MESKFIILSAPSGSGKTSLINFLLSCKEFSLEFSVSATSRKPRQGEQEGKSYFFLTLDQFKNKIVSRDFLEYEEVYKGCFYGTLISEVEQLSQEGKHVIFDMDVEGGLNIKKAYPDRALSIFVKPPSIEELKNRLKTRNTDDEEQMTIRIRKAKKEMTYAEKFDVIIENKNLDKAKLEVCKVVKDFINS